ncbi:MAG: metallophosphoesterase family protein [Candidatus Micrarchaeota archaeon]|nr:metallophosphoesterase family protein [Candidatus Micrarchaeota archaeon]
MRKLLFAFLLFVFVASVAAVPPNQVHLSTTSDPSNSVTVTWQTYSSTSSTVQYGLTSTSLGSTLAGLQFTYPGYEGYLHNATFSGLTPSTTYYYRVGDGVDWNPAVGTFSFTTAPVAGSTAPFTVVAWGDQGQNPEVPLAASGINPNLTIIAGDLAYSSDEEGVDLFFDYLQPIASKVITLVAPGNHEYHDFGAGASTLTSFTNRFAFPSNSMYSYLNERAYSINYGNAHFAFLDLGARAGDSEDEVNSEDVKNWLDADLASLPAGITWKVVVLHFNFYSTSNSHPMRDAQNERRRFEPVFRNRGVDLIVQGHVHNYERMYPLADPDVAVDPDPRNLVYEADYIDPSYPTYIVAGTGGNCCYDLGTEAPWSVSNLEQRGYVKLAFSGNSMTEEFRSSSGALRDTFTISKSRLNTIIPYGSISSNSSNGTTPPPTGRNITNDTGGTNSTPLAPSGNTSVSPVANQFVDFSLSTPASVAMLPGSSASLDVTATQLLGVRSIASLAVSCPATVSCLFNVDANTFNFTSILFVSTLPSTPTGSYSITITATSGAVTRTSVIPLSIVSPLVCSENWQCDEFSTCNGDVQRRACVDVNRCGTAISKPVETIACGQCVEAWECTGWENCAAGTQARQCIDVANCGTQVGKPVEAIQCAISPSGTPFEPSVTQGIPVVAGPNSASEGNFINSAFTSIVSFFSWVTDLFR